MPGRFPGPDTTFAGKDWSWQVGRQLDEALRRIKQGMSKLQGNPRTPTTLTLNTASAKGSGTAPALDDHSHEVDLGLGSKGDSLTHDGTDYLTESVGADGTLLKADSTSPTGRTWSTLLSILGSLLTTKGDILTRDGSTVVRKAVGTNGFALTADSAQADGLRYGPIVSSPAQITGNVNDYAPGVANVYRLDADAPHDVTGLVAGASGATALVVNVSANAITLKHQNAGSAVANRFLCAGAADIVLAADDVALLLYDATTARWRVRSI